MIPGLSWQKFSKLSHIPRSWLRIGGVALGVVAVVGLIWYCLKKGHSKSDLNKKSLDNKTGEKSISAASSNSNSSSEGTSVNINSSETKAVGGGSKPQEVIPIASSNSKSGSEGTSVNSTPSLETKTVSDGPKPQEITRVPMFELESIVSGNPEHWGSFEDTSIKISSCVWGCAFMYTPLVSYFSKEKLEALGKKGKIIAKIIKNVPQETMDPVRCFQWCLGDEAVLKNSKLFNDYPTNLEIMEDPQASFSFASSTEEVMHWTANFADEEIFNFIENEHWFAQEEILAVEHPFSYGIKAQLKKELQLEGSKAILLQSIPRLVKIDTNKKIKDDKTIYGNNFRDAAMEDVESCLAVISPPTYSNIFSIAAPSAQHYFNVYRDYQLEELFLKLCVAFNAMKQVSGGKKVYIHTGNWGCGACGHGAKTIYLLQLVAAQFCQVDQLLLYPRERQAAVEEAQTLLKTIKKDVSPQMTVGEFLKHLAENSSMYELHTGNADGN